MRIPEKYLRHIWQNLYFAKSSLHTVDGHLLKVLSPGTPNFNEGPDFQDAKICINGNAQTGSVELHFQTTDWLKHRHSKAEKYQNVILHVVFQHDAEIDVNLPVFELRHFLSSPLHEILKQCIADENRAGKKHLLACFPLVSQVSDGTKLDWIKSLAFKRLHQKATLIKENRNGKSYDEMIYQGVARALGYSENVLPMGALAQKISFGDIQAYSSESMVARKMKIEAIFFSLSGLLKELQPCDEDSKAYIKQSKFLFQTTSFSQIEPLRSLEWVFFRLRPNNFPTLRIAGLAEILSKNLQKGFLQKANQVLKLSLPLKQKIILLEALFDADADFFWRSHYRFCKASSHKIEKLVGKNRSSEIVINTLLPALLSFYQETFDAIGVAKVQELYEKYPKKLSSEVAKKVLYELLGEDYTVNSACFEQGLLELKKNYCEKQTCLDCKIGQVALGRAAESEKF
ncbi:conserved hypothetical protein [Chloroherpeton thalassium ATCC 35110]|uniref:DUF2851 domain-containing protein n=1 Tax=Chloroherpeton thalassium (strain ATCC 35110 / GB-78) TaxID=517418 RepID=B3QU78_CHLT3|nr:DUF2851 family protein [Chloroherpeton thalassium]ACF12876.1 conserved hypothetical protein [Chloroherpeton thalassium ATCC 35110]